jgi:Lon protease-like protein
MRAPAPHPVPVFPLPDVVLFPGVRLPLHVFELRYRTMVRDALSGGRVLAIATLEPGWEYDYHGSPAFHPLGCLASFERVEWLPNDCYDLVVAGTMRVRFRAVAREFPYRACDVDLLPASPYDEDDPLTRMERSALLDAVQRALPLGPGAWSGAPPIHPELSFEHVVNGVIHALRLPTSERLELLARDSVLDRSRRLGEILSQLKPAAAAPDTDEGGGLN